MNKNIIIGLVVVVVIILGGWFYFMRPAMAPIVPVQNGNPVGSGSDHATSQTGSQTNSQTGSNSAINTASSTKSGVVTSVNVAVGTPSVKNFTVTGENFSFNPSTISVKKGQTVRITFKSIGGMHNFTIDAFKGHTKTLSASDAQETIEFVADKAGSFEYYCSIGQHRQMGMRGTLVVTE